MFRTNFVFCWKNINDVYIDQFFNDFYQKIRFFIPLKKFSSLKPSNMQGERNFESPIGFFFWKILDKIGMIN